MSIVREPAVAGHFYPGAAEDLAAGVRQYLAQAQAEVGPVPKALIAPHAGHIYSGPVAASAYARLRPGRSSIHRVVLAGPSHRVPLTGMAFSGAEAFRTPLGDIPVERISPEILAMPGVGISDRAHGQEHSLEVHLPFLQQALESFSLIPIVVGDAPAQEVADVLEALWGGPETLIVISSDLSHYLDYASARSADEQTCRAIENLDFGGIGGQGACGHAPVSGLLLLARRRGLRVETLDLRNSGDTAGDKSRVVGYGAWAFVEPDSTP